MKTVLFCTISLCSLSLYGSDKNLPDYPHKNEQINFYMLLYSNSTIPRPTKPTLLQRLALKHLAQGIIPKPLEGEAEVIKQRAMLAKRFAASEGVSLD